MLLEVLPAGEFFLEATTECGCSEEAILFSLELP